ncbi:FAD-binding oxidoreductase [Actinomycetospora cinnamomea]|uniref:FAD/FMN-containing dehydrogenase n=1 Tax=Actinomycetospora cinnamomea TaxID=663609 RepID=A0A2U1F7L3_9PSEU|nr:FAD-binding oxidoreductase [Actinomycetospora cinnamomea]PVZ08173.1 FAD/FMN-containing dehydrogenase [Actinomycetospora cinnamomea]
MTATAVGDLADRVAGAVLRPGEEGYEDELAGFDLAVGQRPAIVVGATGPADVIAAVRYARDAGLAVGAQATGHGITVPADDALLITTRRADAVRVDPADRTAWLEAGALWSRLLHEAAPFGLAPLAGSAPAVGAVSYTLGGGLGVLGRRWGFSADHVRRLDIVTADGRPRVVTDDEHPDLFWALRGGGGNFGVVTGMQVELVELAELYGGGLFFPGEAAAEVLSALLAVGRDAPDELSLSAALMLFPDLATVPSAVRGRWCCQVRVSSTGTSERCEQVIAPLRRAATPLLDTVRTMPVTDVGTIHNDPTTPRATNTRSLVLHSADDDAVATVLRHAGPDASFGVELRQLGGALAREPAVPNAVGHRHGAVTVYTTAYPHPAGSRASDGAAEQALLDDLAPWSDGGALVNFLAGPHVTPADVRAAYEPELWTRLAEIKTRWDPGNVFRINHNIPPGATDAATPGTTSESHLDGVVS